MGDDLKLRPLSDGIGLGTLRAPSSRRGETLDINPQVIRHVAHEAYVPQSVASHKRKQPTVRIAVWIVRTCLGWMLDALMLVTSIAICVMLGVVAWRVGAGEVDGLSPVSAIQVIYQYVGKHSLAGILFLFAAAAIVYWGALSFLMGGTPGSLFRRLSK